MSLFSSNNKLNVTLLAFVFNKYINLIVNNTYKILFVFKLNIKFKIIF